MPAVAQRLAAGIPRARIHLHAMLLNRGRERVDTPDYAWHGLRRGAREFVIYQQTLSGQGTLIYQGTVHKLPPGRALLVAVPHDHQYCFQPEDGHWEFVYVSLHGREPVRLLRALIDADGPVLMPTPRLASRVETILAADLSSPFAASALAYDFTMCLLEEVWGAGGGSGEGAIVNRLTDYLKRHLAEPLSVADLARVAGYSRCHFTRLFTRLAGVSPAEFLRQLRLDHALRLLQTERLPIKAIAARCGFADSSHFCKAFRQHCGMSPHAFRNGGA